jgi:hypothetical protein
LIKKENQISSYIRKFRVEQLQRHEEMRKYFTIYEEEELVIDDFATAPF